MYVLTRAYTYISYFRISKEPELTHKKFSGGRSDVWRRTMVCYSRRRRTRRTKGEARRRKFCLFQGQLFGAQGGRDSITFKDDLLLISEGQSVVSFFRAPHVISGDSPQ
jgi:hypothetical protein